MLTVLGAQGFVGSAIVNKLRQNKIAFAAPDRDAVLTGKPLGDVIYCIGLTADFRSRPFDTIEAHVNKLSGLLKDADFNSLTYLSSARMYIHNTSTGEDSPISIDPKDPFDLYNASKITGELLALYCGRTNIKVARLSNVFGFDFNSENFITSIVKDALINKKIILRTTPDSAKDYISVDEVADLLIGLAALRTSGIYNIAGGFNVSNKDILAKIQSLTGCEIEYSEKAERIIFPVLDNQKIVKELNYENKATILDHLETIIFNFQNTIKSGLKP